jgi:branched-chain amino acid transport system ATP-binding protein
MTEPGSLSLRNVAVYYGRSMAVNHIDLDVPTESVVGLVGPNGAGKTSTLRAIAGLIPISAGTVRWRGHNLSSLPPWRRSRLGLAYCSAEIRVFESLSVEENLLIGACALGRRPDQSVLGYIYDVFSVLRERRAQRAGTLSGGEQQMLTIGRALMAAPSLLLLDEPGAGLAPVKVAEVAGIVRRLNADGLTVLVAEQNLDLLDQLEGEAHLLARGDLRWRGQMGQLTRTTEVATLVLGEGVLRNARSNQETGERIGPSDISN